MSFTDNDGQKELKHHFLVRIGQQLKAYENKSALIPWNPKIEFNESKRSWNRSELFMLTTTSISF